MRVSSFSPSAHLSVQNTSSFPPRVHGNPAAPHPAASYPAFLPFCEQAFSLARTRHVPVFLLIGEINSAFSDPSLSMQLSERTVPVHLPAGVRPDIELLCQRAGALFSGEGALPLCALLLDDTRPFLAAPLPPCGYPLDPARLYVWLSQADRRFMQNLPGMHAQAAKVIHSFSCAPPRKPYLPQDAAHDLSRAISTLEDKHNGGLGERKALHVCLLHFLQREGSRGNRQAHASFSRTIDAMLSSPIHDPLDGSFFRATLTDDWHAFVPEKPLGINAMMALILLRCGRRSEAIRVLDCIVHSFSIEKGALSPALPAKKETYAFSPQQVCAALGSEDGLRACRLLGLLHQYGCAEPEIAPSRFSPIPDSPVKTTLDAEKPPLYPTFRQSMTPEDSAFLRRVLPKLLRTRAAREYRQPLAPIISEHMALAAAVLAHCGQKLGETRYTQAAQRAVAYLISQPPATSGPCPLPASCYPISPLLAQATCGASASLSLALLTLGCQDGFETYTQSGLRLLSGALHAFVRSDGLVMHTPKDPAAFFPRIPAIFDNELPSPAALLVRSLYLADKIQPQVGYRDAVETIWLAASPSAHQQPLACASLIDAITAQ